MVSCGPGVWRLPLHTRPPPLKRRRAKTGVRLYHETGMRWASGRLNSHDNGFLCGRWHSGRIEPLKCYIGQARHTYVHSLCFVRRRYKIKLTWALSVVERIDKLHRKTIVYASQLYRRIEDCRYADSTNDVFLRPIARLDDAVLRG
jgi:hypothetical protein